MRKWILIVLLFLLATIIFGEHWTPWKNGTDYNSSDGSRESGSATGGCCSETYVQKLENGQYAIYYFDPPSPSGPITSNITVTLSLNRCAILPSFFCLVYAWNFSTSRWDQVHDPENISCYYNSFLLSPGSRYYSETSGVGIKIVTNLGDCVRVCGLGVSYYYCVRPSLSSLTATPSSGSAPLTVNLKANGVSGSTPRQFHWNFGDGTTRTTSNDSTIHTYSPGTYNPSVYVTNSCGTSAPKSTTVNVSGLDTCSGVTPPTPTGVSASALDTTRIRVTWNASLCATSYKVYRGGTQVGSSSSTSYTDTGLNCGTEYCYTVKACNGSLCSGTSSSACATTNSCGGTPTCNLNVPSRVEFTIPCHQDIATSTFTIRNNGTANCSWSLTYSSSGCSFGITDVSPTSGTLSPGSSRNITVRLNGCSSLSCGTTHTCSDLITVAWDGHTNDVDVRVRVEASRDSTWLLVPSSGGNLRLYIGRTVGSDETSWRLDGGACLSYRDSSSSDGLIIFDGTLNVDIVGGGIRIRGNCDIITRLKTRSLPRIPDWASGFIEPIASYYDFVIIDDCNDSIRLSSDNIYINSWTSVAFNFNGFELNVNDLRFIRSGIRFSAKLILPREFGTNPFLTFNCIEVSTTSIGLCGDACLDAPPFKVGNFNVGDVEICYYQYGDSIIGYANVTIPIARIQAWLKLVGGALDRLIVYGGSSPGIPIGQTGLFLKGLGGGFESMTTPPITLVVIATIGYGGDAITLDHMTLRIRYPQYLEGTGTLLVFNNRVAGGGVRLEPSYMRVWGNVSVINVVVGNFDASLRGSNFRGSIDARVRTPHFNNILLAPISNRDFAHAVVDITNSKMDVGVTINIQEPIFGYTYEQFFAIRLTYDRSVHLYAGLNWNSLIQIFKDREFGPTRPIYIPDNAPQAVFIVYREAEFGDVPGFKLLRPDGSFANGHPIYYPGYYSSNPTVTSESWTWDTTAGELYNLQYFIVDNPMPGNWYFVLPDSVNPDDFNYLAYSKDSPPVVKIIEANVFHGSRIVTKIYASDIDSNAKVTFYLDRDQSGINGIPLDSAFEVDDTLCDTLNTPDYLKTGDYYLYAMIDDNRNAPSYHYYPMPLHIVRGDTLPRPAWFAVSTDDTSFIFRVPKPPDSTYSTAIHLTSDTTLIGSYQNSFGFTSDTIIGDTMILRVSATDTLETDTISYFPDSGSAPIDTVIANIPTVMPGRSYRFAATYFKNTTYIVSGDTTYNIIESGFSPSVVAGVFFADTMGNNPPYFLPQQTKFYWVTDSTYLLDLPNYDRDGTTLVFSAYQADTTVPFPDFLSQGSISLPLSCHPEHGGIFSARFYVSDGADRDSIDLVFIVRDSVAIEPRVYLDKPEYISDTAVVFITVEDWLGNADQKAQDSVIARVCSSYVRCYETDVNSGNFVGTVTINSLSSAMPETLENGDTIICVYKGKRAFAIYHWTMPNYRVTTRSAHPFMIGSGLFVPFESTTVAIGIPSDSGFIPKDTVYNYVRDSRYIFRHFVMTNRFPAESLIVNKNPIKFALSETDSLFERDSLFSDSLNFEAKWRAQFRVQAEPGYSTVSGLGWYDSLRIANFSLDSLPTSSDSVRYIFVGWKLFFSRDSVFIPASELDSFGTGGYYKFSRRIESPMKIKQVWRVEYRFILKTYGLMTASPIFSTPDTIGWLARGANKTVTVSIPDSAVEIFVDWVHGRNANFIGDSTSQTITFTLNGPAILTARFGFWVFFFCDSTSGLRGIFVDDDTIPVSVRDSLKWVRNSTHTILAKDTLYFTPSRRFVFSRWSWLDTVGFNPFALENEIAPVNSRLEIRAIYRPQFRAVIINEIADSLSRNAWRYNGDTLSVNAPDSFIVALDSVTIKFSLTNWLLRFEGSSHDSLVHVNPLRMSVFSPCSIFAQYKMQAGLRIINSPKANLAIYYLLYGMPGDSMLSKRLGDGINARDTFFAWVDTGAICVVYPSGTGWIRNYSTDISHTLIRIARFNHWDVLGVYPYSINADTVSFTMDNNGVLLVAVNDAFVKVGIHYKPNSCLIKDSLLTPEIGMKVTWTDTFFYNHSKVDSTDRSFRFAKVYSVVVIDTYSTDTRDDIRLVCETEHGLAITVPDSGINIRPIFNRQVLAEFILDGTDAEHTVSASYSYLCNARTDSALYGTCSLWVDESTTVVFSKFTTGLEPKVADRCSILVKTVPLPNTFRETIDYSLDTFVVDLHRGWNLLSIPVVPNGEFRYCDLIPTRDFYTYNPAIGGYDNIGSRIAEPFVGFWILRDSDTSIIFKGRKVARKDIRITPGWHLLGSPSTPGHLSELASWDCEPGPIVYNWQRESSSYLPLDILTPGKGFWLLSCCDGILHFGITGEGSFLSMSKPPDGIFPPLPPLINDNSISLPEEIFVLVMPNPFNSTLTIISNAIISSCSIYDLQGKIIKHIFLENDNSAKNLIWDGTTLDGSQAQNGVYFVKVTAGGKSLIRKALLLK